VEQELVTLPEHMSSPWFLVGFVLVYKRSVSCTNTCDKPKADQNCLDPTVDGCTCPDNTYLSGDRCVAIDKCGSCNLIVGQLCVLGVSISPFFYLFWEMFLQCGNFCFTFYYLYFYFSFQSFYFERHVMKVISDTRI
jgi:hypothetical protein